MQIKQITDARRANLRRLIVERFGGSQSNFSATTGISLSQLGQWLAAADSANGRNISERSARRIEAAIGCPSGWLDAAESPTQTIQGFTPLYENTGLVTIPRYDTGGSMGNGVVLRDQPGVIESWNVTREWLEKNVRSYSSVANLCLVTGFGDSMKPTFNPGDPLIVDKGINSVEFDAIYFFRVGDEGFVKRLQRIPTADGLVLRARSDNREYYESFDITAQMDFEVLGRVLKAWKSEDY